MLESDCGGQIFIPIWTWRGISKELKRRGAGRRESGAFLLGRSDRGQRRVTDVQYYDDLDPNALDTGIVTLHGSGLARLFAYCRERNLKIHADIHTHPGPDVRQSDIDMKHPMVAMKGHTAMIAPHLGDTSPWSLKRVGVYEYLGDYAWHAHPASAAKRRVRLCMF